MPAPLLSMRGVRKRFSGVPALVDGGLELHRGEIHALCGGNGAGKSTLLNILMGFLQPDEGEIFIEGQPVHFAGARDALDAGIAIVQQELSAIPDLTVAENIFLGAEPRRFGFVDFRRLNREARELLRSLGFDIDPTSTMKRLSVASQQLVEIAKALSHRNADILIFDEPTSALGERDTARLFQAMRDLASAGKGIIFVTHRMGEIFEVANRYTVLKDGATVATGTIAGLSREQLVEKMVGAPVENEFARRGRTGAVPLLEVRNLTRSPHFEDVSFTLHEGEVLGIYGLMGSGRTEALASIYGLRKADTGSISVQGRTLEGRGAREALDAGIAYVTEDRKRDGLVMCASVRDNLSLSLLPRAQNWGFVDTMREGRQVETVVRGMRIHPPDTRAPVRRLSGGNQQKVVLGRCLLTEPKVLLLDEPTRGVDVAAKKEIYHLISDFVQGGRGAVFVSSELEEILGVSDRILVLRRGRMAGVFPREEASQKALLMAAV
jgi:putative xylitol transport system ATP-binding protein